MKLRAALLAMLLIGAAGPAAAADGYPQRQVKIIVPFPAGAGPDNVARLVAQHLQDAWGQTVLVENRAGALGSIGAAEVAHSAPDGYTLLMGTNTTQASNVATLKNLAYDPAKDFSPIIRTTTTAMVLLVKPDFPAKDLAGFLLVEFNRGHRTLVPQALFRGNNELAVSGGRFEYVRIWLRNGPSREHRGYPIGRVVPASLLLLVRG